MHLASITETSIIGNLMGDFAKGRVENMPYDEEILLGIRLHRFIDSYTDSHEWVKKLKTQSDEYRRYAGIVIDIYFDHLLAVHFDTIHPHQSLSDFCGRLYEELELIPTSAPDRYVNVVSNMRHGRWLEGYQYIHNIKKALMSVEQRFKKPVNLREELIRLEADKSDMEHEFLTFYRELQSACRQFISSFE